jgi:hypothetical protein
LPQHVEEVEEFILLAVEGTWGQWCKAEGNTAEPVVPECSPLEVEVVIEKLNRYKSPGIDQILAELIQARGETLHSQMHESY